VHAVELCECTRIFGAFRRRKITAFAGFGKGGLVA